MAKLAIKGHKVSGRFVISLLKMMGGRDSVIPCAGTNDGFYYFVDSDGIITAQLDCDKAKKEFKLYTYGEFIENFPYKVGDKVRYFVYVDVIESSVEKTAIVKGMTWHKDTVIYTLDNNTKRMASDMYPIEEETSSDKAKAPVLQGQDYSEGRCGYRIPEGFEFDKVEDGEIILKPKKKEFPNTYGECCEVLGISREGSVVFSGDWVYGGSYLEKHHQILCSFSKLLVCRDAYWKLAGEEMRLGGPWENNYGKDDDYDKFFLANDGGILCSGVTIYQHYILAFPTAEMRNTFYDNFKGLIGECKELL